LQELPEAALEDWAAESPESREETMAAEPSAQEHADASENATK